MDMFLPDERSAIMRRVRSQGTRPEILVRKILRGMGIRYRSCLTNLPGKPDLVLVDKQMAIFVHGCFWHGHRCGAGELPKSNRSYWENKQAHNMRRDSRNTRALRSKGWKVMLIWECEVRSIEQVKSRILGFLRRQQ